MVWTDGRRRADAVLCRRAESRPVQTYDLSQTLATGMPVYPGTDPVGVEPAATRDGDGYRTTRLDLDSHAGTHVDAPAHLVDGPALGEFPLDRFAFDAALVDARDAGAREAIGVDRFRAGLAGDPEAVDIAVLATGWDSHWGTERYFDHPYLTAAAAEWLADRGLDLAVDTVNPDPTPTDDAVAADSDDLDEPDGYPAHEALFERDRLIVENLRGLGRLPPRFELRAYPLRFDGADASPVRAVGVVSEGTR